MIHAAIEQRPSCYGPERYFGAFERARKQALMPPVEVPRYERPGRNGSGCARTRT